MKVIQGPHKVSIKRRRFCVIIPRCSIKCHISSAVMPPTYILMNSAAHRRRWGICPTQEPGDTGGEGKNPSFQSPPDHLEMNRSPAPGGGSCSGEEESLCSRMVVMDYFIRGHHVVHRNGCTAGMVTRLVDRGRYDMDQWL